MQRRILTSTFALLALTTAAGAAQASSNVTITGSGSHNIADTASDRWTKNTDWGTIGAYYSAGYDLYSNYSGSSQYEKISGTVGGVLFGKDLPFANVAIKAHAGKTQTLKGDYDLSIFGVTLINIDNLNLDSTGKAGASILLAEMPYGVATVSANGNWGTDGVDLSVDVTATVDADMTLAGVPLVFSAGASGAVGINVAAKAAAYDSSNGASSINFSAEPYAQIDLVGSAGVGVSWANVGAYGSLTLLYVGVPVENQLTLTPLDSTSGYMEYSTSGKLNLSSLGGEIGLYVYIWPVTYSYALFDWDGIDWADELLFTDSIPLAAAPTTTVSGANATFSYVYADANPESGSTIKWYRADNASGLHAGPISTTTSSSGSSTYSLTDMDSMRYLRACVTPSNGVNSGSQVCSSWTSVGPLLTYFWDTNYGGSSMAVAYKAERNGYCFTMQDIKSGWNDEASSYKLQAVPGCTTVLQMYNNWDCNDSQGVATRTLASGVPGEGVSSMSSTLGSGWNDVLTSFKVVYCDEVSASNVSINFDGTKAEGSYLLNSASLFQSDESTFRWYYATNSNGSGSTQFSTSSSITMSPAQAGNYLKFCLTPNNGTTAGDNVCTGWTRAPAVTFYWDTNYGGSSLVYPYKQVSSGTCVNISNVKSGWNDEVSSLKLNARNNNPATIYLYKDANCSGGVASTIASAGSTASVSSFTNTYGSGWNDVLSSFKVVY